MSYNAGIVNLRTSFITCELRRSNKITSDEIFKAIFSYCNQHLLFADEKLTSSSLTAISLLIGWTNCTEEEIVEWKIDSLAWLSPVEKLLMLGGFKTQRGEKTAAMADWLWDQDTKSGMEERKLVLY